ncbi:MAG: glutathione S-transferase, partial [Proteobacteria bacterium]|nr:glutathione S-transferase [Pseudomonadota bacterium]
QANGLQWLVGSRPTIADIACFPYTALASEGGVTLDEFPAIRQWLWHFRSQSRFVGMAGIMALELTPH